MQPPSQRERGIFFTQKRQMYIFTTFIQPLEIFFQRQQQKHEQHKEIRKIRILYLKEAEQERCL